MVRNNHRLVRAATLLTALGAGAALFFGCSLTGVTDINVGECESDESCRLALNEDEGFYPECAAFECVSNGTYNQCQRIEGERADGLDNDCDQLIDEAETGEDSIYVVELDELASGIPNSSAATIASSETLTQVYIQQNAGQASAIDLESGKSNPVRVMANAVGDTSPNYVIDLIEGCYSPGTGPAQSCRVSQSVAAAGAGIGYFAQIKTEGCASGELRVGAIDPTAPGDFIDRGPGTRNPAYRGVATRGSQCTDNGRPACVQAKDTYTQLTETNAPTAERMAASTIVTDECGASRPAIAATGKQALVAFLGAQVKEDVCATGPVDILGLVLHERIKSYGDKFVWAESTGEGIPDVIGKTSSARPPAIQALPNAGFLVAHTDAAGNIALLYVPKQENPPGVTGIECLGDQDVCDGRSEVEDERTQPLSGITTVGSLSGGGQTEGVRVTWLSLDGNSDEAAVAVTWAQGCWGSNDDLPDAQAFAQVIRLKLSDDGAPEITWKGPVLSLGKTRSFPIAVPSKQTFFIEGFERGDRTATKGDTGGFFFITRPLGIQAIRVASFDGQEVVAGEVIAIAADQSGPAPSYRYLAELGDQSPDEFLLTRVGEGTIWTATFTSGN